MKSSPRILLFFYRDFIIRPDTFLPQKWAVTIEVDYLLSKIREPWPEFNENAEFERGALSATRACVQQQQQ